MKTRVLLLVWAALLFVWGLFGLLDLRNTAWGGFDHFHSIVVELNEGGPADRAGLMLGDSILSMGGVSVVDTYSWVRRPPPEVGDTRSLVVERTDERTGATTTESIEVTYSQEPTRASALWSVNWVIELAFLLCGMLVYLKAPGTPSLLFSIVGLCFGGFLLPRPHIGSFDLRMLTGNLFFIALCIGCACFLHLLLIFPKRKRVMEKNKAGQLIYLPLAAIALVGMIRFTIEGLLGDAVSTIVAILVAIVLLGYLVLSMVALVHRNVRAAPHERAEEGLNTLLAGVLLGLLPITIVAVSRISLSISPPDSRFDFLPLVLIPMSFAWALLRGSRASRL